jgi:hypothetical protein
MNWNWKTGLLAQAKSDYAMYQKLEKEQAARCYRLLFLQMATEKLAKGMVSDGTEPPELSHRAFVSFIKEEARTTESVRIACGFLDKAAYICFLRGIQGIVKFIEDLHPRGVDKFNPEYPWEHRALARDGTIQIHVHVPSSHEWLEWNFSPTEEKDLRRFLEGCFRVVEQDLPKDSDSVK